jgi:hypothetical protein
MEPITITKNGDVIKKPAAWVMVNENTKIIKFDYEFGVHRTADNKCGQNVTLTPISATSSAIKCKCGLRIIIPTGISTYSQLRSYMQKALA